AELHDYLHQEIDTGVAGQIVETRTALDTEQQPDRVSMAANPVESVGNYVLTQINLDKQNIDSEHSQREFDADVLDIFIEE
ncbi:hypothetical protein, partial [Enterobacter asburiae]|uniref:hypothetical protein n=1 Tax=Enterobacter asburiae TaxID=61645 RepID=UPI0022F0AFDD